MVTVDDSSPGFALWHDSSYLFYFVFYKVDWALRTKV